jgi:hypothetical protein
VTQENLKNSQFGPPGPPENVGGVLQQGVEYSIERLIDRLRIITHPLPKPSDPNAAIRALMIRDSIDLATRECSAVTRFISWNADVIAATTRTQNRRRRQIVPATPSCLRLKETAIQAANALNDCCAEAWTRDDVSSEEMLPVLEKLFVPGHAENFLNGRPSLLGVASSRLQLGRLLYAMQRLESHWGSFEIWARRPRLSTCKSLIRAWQSGEIDFDEFLSWFREAELGLHGNALDPYIAQALFGMRITGTELIMPGDMTVKRGNEEMSFADSSESELYDKLLQTARLAKWLYKSDGRIDSAGNIIREVAYLDPLYSESGEIESRSTIDEASWRVSDKPEIRTEYEDWNGILKSAGLTPPRRRALILRKNGQITSRERLNEWKRGERAIKSKRSELVGAIEAATKRRIVMAPQISAASYSGVFRDRGSIVRALPSDDEPLQSIPSEARASKWFDLNPPPISVTIRKTKHLFKKLSTPGTL